MAQRHCALPRPMKPPPAHSLFCNDPPPMRGRKPHTTSHSPATPRLERKTQICLVSTRASITCRASPFYEANEQESKARGVKKMKYSALTAGEPRNSATDKLTLWFNCHFCSAARRIAGIPSTCAWLCATRNFCPDKRGNGAASMFYVRAKMLIRCSANRCRLPGRIACEFGSIVRLN